MKKRERARKDGNVVFFPHLEKRLFEKGLDFIQRKQFREALPYFEEAKKHDPENSDIWFALVLAYYESGAYEKAKEYTEEMLRVGIGEYFQTVDMLIMVLVQLQEYNRVVHTIEVLFEEHEVPVEKYDHFKRLLDFSRRMVDAKEEEQLIEPEYEKEVAPQSLNLFDPKDEKELLLQVANLAHQNIQPVLGEIRNYLQSSDGQPFIKTMLLHVLKEHQYHDQVTVTKLSSSMEVTPKELYDLREHPQKIEVSKILAEQLEQENPTLLEQAISLIDRHLFILYPFHYPTSDMRALAAAYHILVLMFFAQDYTIEEMSDVYQSSQQDIETLLRYIQEIEEFSYPII
ncbi:tetratricopeptide repeat protein [Robertmurraya korlensis]|uniref:tetratricopeptide repeat protein n=1 Tax=Robertmurraya korlensis TaxID=519977 RepID=UPI00204088C1|nr:tetratricopeptide repeat protein [Robertmurraya korlensis]MCM3599333.1 tetratricopeptide repeat protein [Robertmurraya korlensis]